MLSLRGLVAVLVTGFVLAIPLYQYREFLTRGMQPSEATLRLNKLEKDGVPDFSLPNLQGKPVSLYGYSGKVVVLNLWASWCGPCVKEFPSLRNLALKFPEDLVILAVSHDSSREDLDSFISTFGQLPTNFVVVWDKSRETSALYGSDVLPESYILKRDLKLVRKVVGEQVWDHPEALQFFKDIMALK